jgi:TRAP-type C4-dicarboxylate transport system substrate-binding protein
LLFTVTFSAAGLIAQEFTIKFATVAPEGTSWMNVMKEYDAAVRKESGGRLGFRIYANSVQGDEKVVLRKIKAGQLHAGGFTGVAMGEIASKVRILDSPFLFRTYDEIDYIYDQFDKEFRQAFEEGGYVLLGWAEVGFVHVFTNVRVAKPQDMKSLKMWSWEGDPIAEALFQEFDINPIPLALTDVMTSLQTGLIDAFYASTYAALTLQWYTRAKYMIDVRLADAAGAVLLSKKYYDKLSPDLQEILLRSGRIYFKRLTELSRKDNATAIEIMKTRGISLVEASPADYQYYDEKCGNARRNLVGKVYTEDFLSRIEKTIADFRSSRKAP